MKIEFYIYIQDSNHKVYNVHVPWTILKFRELKLKLMSQFIQVDLDTKDKIRELKLKLMSQFIQVDLDTKDKIEVS